ncbi:TetR family transcriptional regulator [Denitrobacterium detoxificans]|nr:TetR family transcriptional regulator [Denitrobacterium detoxificans]
MKSSPQTQQLSRERIAHVALRLADHIGIENVSMRKLAAELGVTAMALYRYYGSVDEIQVAALALAFTEVDTHPIPGERWDDTIRRTTSSIREMYLNHSTAHLHTVESTGADPGMEEHIQRVYKLHEDQGIPAPILRKAWRIIDAYMGGFILGETDEVQHRSKLPHEETAETWRETAAGAYSEETFHDGIEIIIAGIRAMAEPDPCDWHTPEDPR